MSNLSNFMWQLMWLFLIVSALQPILQQRMLGAARQRTILRFEMPSALLPSALGNAIIVVVTHHFAYPLRGVGIALPLFVALLAAAAVAIILGRSMRLPRGAHFAAYVSGVLGTLIGADLTNLHRIAQLGAPVGSIAGAGTFDVCFSPELWRC